VQPWLETFNRFFEDLPYAFRKRYQNSGAPAVLTAPRLWKTLGDEVVFETVLGSRAEAATHLEHFRETLIDYRTFLKEADGNLDIKGTAWLSGFPVGNSVVYLTDPVSGDKWEDYIGPSMDIGFRLKDFANPRRIAVSVELAYLLSAGEGASGSTDCDLPLHLADAHTLKGVIQNHPYPAFWLECDSPEADDELLALERPLRATADRAATMAFCERFISQHSPPLFLPFIDGDPEFSALPEDYNGDYAEISDAWAEHYAGKTEPAADSALDEQAIEENTDRFRALLKELLGALDSPKSD
jgi:hypothetical protein